LGGNIGGCGGALACYGEFAARERIFRLRLVMKKLGGNKSRVAKQLGLSRLGLHKKLTRYGL
jgi:transcriptional regulator of acetoin/glycerol metabolism